MERQPGRRLATPIRSTVRGLLLVMLAVGVLATTGVDATGHSLPLSGEEIARRASRTFVGVARSRSSRWNAQHNLILTDWEFTAERSLKGDASGAIRITVPGGTLDGETHDTCVTPRFSIGSRYLLFLEGPERSTLEPVVGGPRGAYREIALPDGTIAAAAGNGGVPMENGGRPLAFDDLVEQQARLIERVSAAHAAAGSVDPAPSPGAAQLPQKIYDAAAGRSEALPAIRTPASNTADVAPPIPPDTASRPIEDEATRSPGNLIPEYSYQRRPPAPIIFDQLPPNLAPWAPLDQNMMARWNRYGDVFRVLTTPSGTWAWMNGRFDMAGFPSNDTMVRQFGRGWGASTLAVTWSRWTTGPIIEADVAVNPAFGWTTDTEFGTRPDGAWDFQQTVLHELGHAWGLKHPWETQDVWWDSVMNYSPKEFRFPILTADDTQAIRSAYPGISVEDGFVSSYFTDDGAGMSPEYTGNTFNPAKVIQGRRFALADLFKLENTGTVSLVNPVIEFWLTPRRLLWDGAIFLASRTSTATVPSFSTQWMVSGNLRVPSTTPPGKYYVGLYHRNASDAYTNNNSAWTDHGVRVTIVNSATSIVPQKSWQTFWGSLGPEGRWIIGFDASAAWRYDFSFCDGAGGFGTFDALIDIISPSGAVVTSSDDVCGLLPEIRRFAPENGRYQMRIRGFEGAGGDFAFSYRRKRQRAASATSAAPAQFERWNGAVTDD